ncbi:MAG TPA: glutamate-5-semialdehyde dehydrogenase, partial [Massilibacterium sp.]|nr:glutamate-5-semialdehyde dehydrogenase [Massilibacterium sp.]
MGELIEKANKLKKITQKVAVLTTEQKNEALQAIAVELRHEVDFILKENQKDLLAGEKKGLTKALLDRLTLTEDRIEAMASAMEDLCELEDPVGEVLESWERPNGLKIKQVRVPLGVVGMIYEARPNVTIDAASLSIKTGNGVLLRGSSSAIYSNQALVKVIHQALAKTDVPVDAVQLLEDTSRETANAMFQLNEYLDVLIPRGGAGLIQSVVKNSSIPVLETGAGNCHVYIDESAKKEMGIEIAINAKTQRPSVCNAAETIIVQKDWAKEHLQDLVNQFQAKGVEVRGDKESHQFAKGMKEATEEDFATEFLDLIVALKIVDNVNGAINHIRTYGTKHSESIVSETEENVVQFFNHVDASTVYHNASTRFTDGFEFGFGAEIGISTQKLHARGPMGLKALTSTKYIVEGNGH